MQRLGTDNYFFNASPCFDAFAFYFESIQFILTLFAVHQWSLCKAAKTTFEILTFKLPHTEIFQRCIISLEFQIEWWKKIKLIWWELHRPICYNVKYFQLRFIVMLLGTPKVPSFEVNWNTPIPQFAISILIFGSIKIYFLSFL